MVRERGGLILKVIVSGVLLFYLFHRVGISQILTHVHRVRMSLFLWALLFYITAVVVSSVKWWVLLRAQGLSVPYRSLLRYTLVGAFFNTLLPANVGGDVMRGYGLARHAQASEAAVSVIVDRLVGLFAFMSAAALAGSALLLLHRMGQAPLRVSAAAHVRTLTFLAWVSEGGMLAGLGVLLSRRSKRWVEARLRVFPGAQVFVPSFRRVADALNAYRHAYRALSIAVLISWGVLLLTSLENWFLAEALRPAAVPFLYVLLFNPLIAFALLIPLSLGGLGIGQSAYVFFYGLVGIPEALAFTLSLLHQTVVYVAALPGAFLWVTMKRGGSRFRRGTR